MGFSVQKLHFRGIAYKDEDVLPFSCIMHFIQKFVAGTSVFLQAKQIIIVYVHCRLMFASHRTQKVFQKRTCAQILFTRFHFY